MVGCRLPLSSVVPPRTTPLYISTSSPISAVSPMTTPMPWSMKNRRPMVAPGWISMPVSQRLTCETRRASQTEPALPKRVGQAVHPEGMQPRIAGQHFQQAPRRGVLGENGLDILSQQSEQAHLWAYLPWRTVILSLSRRVSLAERFERQVGRILAPRRAAPRRTAARRGSWRPAHPPCARGSPPTRC